MPYPSTPLVGALSPSTSAHLSSSVAHLGLHQPSHRTTALPVSCMRQPLATSASAHHLITIGSASGATDADGYFTAAFEGATRTPMCSPTIGTPGSTSSAGTDAWSVLFGRAGAPGSQSLGKKKDTTHDGAKGVGGGEGKRGGLRISEMPPFVMARMGTWGSEGSEESAKSEEGEADDDAKDAKAGWRMKRQRTATPFPVERDEWLEDPVEGA